MRVKVWMSVALIALWGLSFNAQAGQVSFGLKAGANMAKYDTEGGASDLTYGSLTRIGGGAVISVALSSVIGLDTDLLYMQKGLSSEVVWQQDNYYYSDEREMKLAYAVIAPMVKIGGRKDSVSPYLLAGGEVGFLLDAKLKADTWSGNPDNAHSNEYDIKDQLEDVAYGLTFGAGIDIPTGGALVFVEGRYVLGLSNIWPSDYLTMGEQKSRDVYLMGGVRF